MASELAETGNCSSRAVRSRRRSPIRSPSPGSSTSMKSDVWKYFEKTESSKAKCTLCFKQLSYRGGTTNLRDHLTSQHPLNYKHQPGSKKQATLDLFSKPRRCPESRAKEITDRIVNMLALDLRPVYMVECEGFREFLACLEPGYTVLSRKLITGMIRRKHEVCKERLCEKLKMASSVALTTDIWTSRATQAYITVSAHYITEGWELFAFVLETRGFPERHTGQAISEKLSEIAKNFALTEKVTAVVHDQAANMELSLEILNRDLGWESLHCSAHCLQLCLKAGFSINAIDRLVGAARKLVGHFNHSVVASEQLKRRQAQMGNREKKLVQECATRWNSTFYMLERLLEMRWPVSAVLSDEQITKRSDRSLHLRTEQWTLLK